MGSKLLVAMAPAYLHISYRNPWEAFSNSAKLLGLVYSYSYNTLIICEKCLNLSHADVDMVRKTDIAIQLKKTYF